MPFDRFQKRMDGGLSSTRPVRAGTVLLCVVALLVPGCATKRAEYDVPPLVMPGQYKNSSSETENATAAGYDAIDIPSKLKVPYDPGLNEWWRSFGNRELEDLIDRGLANNPDLRIAMLQVAQAKERADQAEAGKLPTVAIPLLAGAAAPAGGSAGDVPNSGGGITNIQQSYQASIRGTWRVDVWGEQSALAESAKFQLWRAVFQRDDIQRHVVANLSSAYVEYISLNERLKVARENEKVLGEILTSLERRVEVGDATITDSSQQKAAIFAVRATIPSLEQQREDVLNTIAFLVGAAPGTLTLSDNGLNSISTPSVVPGLPSSLLLRRPDVRMAEARLLAADADIDVARARILPPIDLSAQAGFSSVVFSQLFMAKSLFWNSIASLSATIFDGGKKQSDKKLSQVVHEEMVETYAKTISQALKEVEGALSSVRLTEKRLDAARKASEAARQAWEISTKAYELGGADYQTFLDTERTYHRYLDDYQRIRMENSRGYITLFSALGGGVRQAEALPGPGVRPATELDGAAIANPALFSTPASNKTRTYATEGVDRATGAAGGMKIENFWQVELPALYHRTAIGAAWRDLRARYPRFMENRFLRPRLHGRISDSEDGQESWYRLYVAKFSSIESADEFCRALQTDFQRCRIVSSRSDETVKNDGSEPEADKVTPPDAVVEQVKPVAAIGVPGTDAKAVTETPRPTEPVAVSFALHVDPAVKSVELPQPPAVAPVPSQSNSKVEPPVNKSPAKESEQKLAYTLQLGQFANLENAEILKTLWQSKGYKAFIAESPDKKGRVFYGVRTGIYPKRRDANAMALSIRHEEHAPVVVVPTMVDLAGKPISIENSDAKLAGGQVPLLPEPPEEPKAQGASAAEPSQDKDSVEEKSLYAVQLGAFSSQASASVSRKFWSSKGYAPYVSEIQDGAGRTWYAVRTGEFSQRQQAGTLAKSIGRKVGVPAIVVPVAAAKSAKNADPGNVNAGPVVANPAVSAEPKTLSAENTGSHAAPGIQSAENKPRGLYTLQLGVFDNLKAAEKSYKAWKAKGYEAYVCKIQATRKMAGYAVRAGSFAERNDADSLIKTIARKDKHKATLVAAKLDAAGHIEKLALR